jgi:DNA-binding FrmR family transcriptional regulator
MHEDRNTERPASRKNGSPRKASAKVAPKVAPKVVPQAHDHAHQHAHVRHPEIIARLRRAEGHLKSTIEMIAEERPCLTLAQQLQAVESAIANARKILIQEHIKYCLDEATEHLPKRAQSALEEFKSVARYL